MPDTDPKILLQKLLDHEKATKPKSTHSDESIKIEGPPPNSNDGFFPDKIVLEPIEIVGDIPDIPTIPPPEPRDPKKKRFLPPDPLTYKEYQQLPDPYKALPEANRIRPTTNSYSGADIRALVHVGDRVHLLGNVQTISYSIHRDKMPVRTLGRTYPKSYVRGPRTVAGSMIFTVFDRHALWDVLQYHARDLPEIQAYTPLSDMLPPFDMTIVFDNEYGAQSAMRIFGLEIVDEGQTMSIDDMITENTMSYIARNIELMATSRTEAFGPAGKVFQNRGVFVKGNVPDEVVDQVGEILDTIAQLRLELAGGQFGNNIPTASRAREIKQEIEVLEKTLKNEKFDNYVRIQGRSTAEDVNRYNIPWDFRTRKQARRRVTVSHPTTTTGSQYKDHYKADWETK